MSHSGSQPGSQPGSQFVKGLEKSITKPHVKNRGVSDATPSVALGSVQVMPDYAWVQRAIGTRRQLVRAKTRNL